MEAKAGEMHKERGDKLKYTHAHTHTHPESATRLQTLLYLLLSNHNLASIPFKPVVHRLKQRVWRGVVL